MKKDLGSYSTVLVVEDESDLLDVIQEGLSEHFMDVLRAKNGQEALDVLSTRAVDIVVTDYLMPVMNGLELIEKMRVICPMIPIIMLTGNGTNPEVLLALKLGAFDVLDKPYRIEVLVNRIQNSLLLPQLSQLLWSLLSRELPAPKIEEFLSKPYSQQIQMLHGFSKSFLTRGIIKGDSGGAT